MAKHLRISQIIAQYLSQMQCKINDKSNPHKIELQFLKRNILVFLIQKMLVGNIRFATILSLMQVTLLQQFLKLAAEIKSDHYQCEL
jgi:hypothetical protein